MDFEGDLFDAFSSTTLPETAVSQESKSADTLEDKRGSTKKVKLVGLELGSATSPVDSGDLVGVSLTSSTFANAGFKFMKGSVDVLDSESSEDCKHTVIVPEGAVYVPISDFVFPAQDAKEYPFQLDPFQAHGVQCLEKHESVLISAHTSAGKTVLAEYAIAMSLRDNQRVIYTTPIKALSNQKFREFSEEFTDVGLMTGDVTLNPNASIMVMTTEILRNMLYRGSDLIRETKWIVFDEIHYMRDKERGVVWEETLILFSSQTRFVFLSATIPNAVEFASWISQLHRQVVHVIYTEHRPTPLQHYLFPAGCEGLYLVVDQNGLFKEDNYDKAMAALAENIEVKKINISAVSGGTATGSISAKGKSGVGDLKSDIYKLVKMTMERKLAPVICFSFSKRECEKNAVQIASLSLNTDNESKMITEIFDNALLVLQEEDRKLPQVCQLLPLLQKGIGIHHSGLLPFLKELVEILFQENLLKILFATETFAMGLNMPARTVIFTSITKWDGKMERVLTGGEYIQMSGRAGRRGLDDKGIVIQMVKETLKKPVAVNLLKGKSDKLFSAFHITYNMLLNLLRIDELSPEYILERSFHQFQNVENVPILQAKLDKLHAKMELIVINNEPLVEEYYLIRDQLEKLRRIMTAIIFSPEYILSYLQPGRLVHLTAVPRHPTGPDGSTIQSLESSLDEGDDNIESLECKLRVCEDSDQIDAVLGDRNLLQLVSAAGDENGTSAIPLGWGTIINFHKKKLLHPPNSTATSGTDGMATDGMATDNFAYVVEVLVYVAKESTDKFPEYCSPGSALGEPRIIPVVLSMLDKISSVRIKLPKDLSTHTGQIAAHRFATETLGRFKGELPLLDPLEDMKIANDQFTETISRIELLEKRLFQNPIFKDLNSTASINSTSSIRIAINAAAVAAASDNTISCLSTVDYPPDIAPIINFNKYKLKVKLSELHKSAQKKLKETVDLLQMSDLKARKRLLRRLAFTSTSDNIEIKGRVACEISTSDPVLLTELIFSGIFTNLSCEITVAILSVFVFDEKSSSSLTLGILDSPDAKKKIIHDAFNVNYGQQASTNAESKHITQEMRQEMFNTLKKIEATARHIVKKSNECALAINEDDYISQFSNQMALSVLSWALGSTFAEMKEHTQAFEGSIIRSLRRLDEMLRQLAIASQVMGNTELYQKFIDGSTKIKRGIIFASSLYL